MKRHLVVHSGDKSNKCNQCDFAFAQAANLRTHLKTHSGEKYNICNHYIQYTTAQAGNLRKLLLVHSGEKFNKCSQSEFRQFEVAFENAQWRKGKQMPAMWYCIIAGKQLEDTFENTWMKKSPKNALNVIMHLFVQLIWGRIWKCTVVKS